MRSATLVKFPLALSALRRIPSGEPKTLPCQHHLLGPPIAFDLLAFDQTLSFQTIDDTDQGRGLDFEFLSERLWLGGSQRATRS